MKGFDPLQMLTTVYTVKKMLFQLKIISDLKFLV